MPLGSLLVFVNFSMSVAAVVLLVYAIPFKKFRPVQYLILLNVGFILLSFCTINVLVVQDYEWKVVFSRLRFVGLSILGQSFLLLMSKTLNRFMWLHKKWVVAGLFLPSLVTITLSLVPSLRDLMVTDFQPYTYADLHVLKFRGGPWFKFHMLTGYLTVGFAAYLCIHVLFTDRGLRRKQALILFSALLVTILLENYCLLTASPLRWTMVMTSAYCLNQFAILYCSFVLGFGHLIVLARQRIFELVPDPILVFDYQSRLALLNDAARNVFGFNQSEITRNIGELVSQDLITPGMKAIKNRTGDEFIYDVQERKLSDDPNHAFGTLIYFRNVTKQKQAEQRLEALLQFDADLLSMISHDLSGNLQNQARLAAGIASRLPPEDKKIGAILEESAFASRDLIHALITWAKSQSIDLPSPRKPFELQTLVEDSIAHLRPLMAVKSLSCEMKRALEPIILVGDSGMISSVVRNLVTNAINASHDGDVIEVVIEKDETHARFSVIDRGPGISETDLNQALHEAHADAREESSRGSKGYGVGIKLSQKFITAHKGELSIRGLSGVGTTATVSLPV